MPDSIMKTLQKLSELELSSRVIRPLLISLFPDSRIEMTHGSNESGRDYICYTTHHILRQTHIICIQLKNKKINRSIGSPYSISTVRHQLQTAKETGVIGPNNERVMPDEVWFINTYDCTDTFRREAASDFEAIKKLSGRVVDGTELELLLINNCPEIVSEMTDWANAKAVDLLSQLSSHRESRAFGLRFDRIISDFYINTRLSTGSRLIDLFEQGYLKITDANVTCSFTLPSELTSGLEKKGDCIIPEDVDGSPHLRVWSNLVKRFPIDVSWTLKISSSPALRATKDAIVDRTYQFKLRKTVSLIKLKLSEARKEFPSSVKGNEHVLRSTVSMFLSVNDFLSACDLSGATERPAGKIQSRRPPIVQVDSEEGILSLGATILVEGGPGSGKTTFLRRISVAVIKRGEHLTYLECARVNPNAILKSINEEARRIRYTNERFDNSTIYQTVLSEIQTQASTTGEKPAQDHVCVLDGLDELPSGLLPIFVGFILSTSNTFKVLVASCRDTYETELRGRVPVLTVSRFDSDDRDKFFSKWFRNDVLRYKSVTRLLAANPDIAYNARIPLIATLIAALVENDREPGSRLEIYRERSRLLLGYWDQARDIKRSRVSVKSKERFLHELAFKLHYLHQREISQEDAKQIYLQVLGRFTYSMDFDEFISELVKVAGVLIKSDNGSLSFGHLSFQEHFTAENLASKARPQDIRHLLGQNWWIEPLKFLAAIKGDITDLLEYCSEAGCIDAYCDQLLSMTQLAPFTDGAAVEMLEDTLGLDYNAEKAID